MKRDLEFEKIKKNQTVQLQKFKQQGIENHRLWNIGEKSCQYLWENIRKLKPEHILEIGTSNGYSTFWISLAASEYGGLVETIEVNRNRYELARLNLSSRENVVFHFGLAEEIIPNLTNSYDFVFIDANKTSYLNYLQLMLSKLVLGCQIIADNVISHGQSVNEYLDFVRNNPYFVSETLAIEAGLERTIYRRGIQR